MERQFGDSTLDTHANHKGEWCLYESRLCQESLGCNRCQIHIDMQEKWHVRQLAELNRIFSGGDKEV